MKVGLVWTFQIWFMINLRFFQNKGYISRMVLKGLTSSRPLSLLSQCFACDQSYMVVEGGSIESGIRLERLDMQLSPHCPFCTYLELYITRISWRYPPKIIAVAHTQGLTLHMWELGDFRNIQVGDIDCLSAFSHYTLLWESPQKMFRPLD